MVKKILTLVSIIGASSLYAQSGGLPSTAKLWNKNDSNYKSNNLRTLNGYAQLSIEDYKKQGVLNTFQSKDATLYVVFKSNDVEPVDIINYKFRCYETSLNSQIKDANISNESIIKKKIQTGAIFKHEFHLPFDENNLEANTFFINDLANDKTDLYEIFYFDKSFTIEDHKSIQTYLSLKYGITLINIDHYVNANGVSIWNSSLNPTRNNHITGIGRNDKSGLYHTKSTNSTDAFLTLQSKNQIKDDSYILVADSDHSLQFQEGVCNRKWLVQSTKNNEIITDLIFDTKQIVNYDASQKYFLIISNNTDIDQNSFDLVSMEPTQKNGKLIFENLKWNGIQSFTIMRSETQKVESKIELAKRFLLNNGHVTIEPSVYNPSHEKITYQWILDDVVIGNEKKLTTNKEGLYTLKTSTESGLNSNYQTQVVKITDATNEFTVYPNPVVSGEKFSIHFDLSEKSDIEVSVFQSNGKYLFGKNEKAVEQFTFENTLLSSGTYLIVAVINGKTSLKKLVVK